MPQDTIFSGDPYPFSVPQQELRFVMQCGELLVIGANAVNDPLRVLPIAVQLDTAMALLCSLIEVVTQSPNINRELVWSEIAPLVRKLEAKAYVEKQIDGERN